MLNAFRNAVEKSREAQQTASAAGPPSTSAITSNYPAVLAEKGAESEAEDDDFETIAKRRSMAISRKFSVMSMAQRSTDNIGEELEAPVTSGQENVEDAYRLRKVSRVFFALSALLRVWKLEVDRFPCLALSFTG